jgi:hypothetical protein
MTVRGGGVPCRAMAFVPLLRMGPPPRSLAADAHACIMVRGHYDPTGYKVAARVPSRPDSELPSDASSRPQQACRRARVCQGSAWKRPSGGQRRATAVLDSPCARRLPTRVGRGEETGFQVEQRNWMKKVKNAVR